MAKYLILKKRRVFLKAAMDTTYVTHHVVIQAAFCAEKKDEALPRIGFTATKKIGKAFYRNRNKRRLRAVVREIEQRTFLNGVDYVFVGRRDTGYCPYEKLKNGAEWALKKINSELKNKLKEHEKNPDSAD